MRCWRACDSAAGGHIDPRIASVGVVIDPRRAAAIAQTLRKAGTDSVVLPIVGPRVSAATQQERACKKERHDRYEPAALHEDTCLPTIPAAATVPVATAAVPATATDIEAAARESRGRAGEQGDGQHGPKK